MLKRAMHRLLVKKHFWRYASFGDLVDLYSSNMLRAVASSLFSIFVPVFLLKSGYSVFQVCLYYLFYFFIRFLADIICGFAIAKIGPKHAWIVSHLANILSLLSLLMLPQYSILFFVSATFNAIGSSFQFVPLNVDFSKIKHAEHNGKEQSFFLMLEKVGSAVGPLLGGYIAATYGASYTILASVAIYLLSLIPLLASPEPTELSQRITFKGFPFKKLWRDIASNCARATDATVTMGMWPIFMTIAIFKTDTYQSIGFISTASIVVALSSTFLIGRLIDTKKSLLLLRISVIGDSLIYIARIFSRTLPAAFAVNAANEVAVAGVSMSYLKGAYSAADDLPGYRIVYFVVLEAIGEIPKFIMWAVLAALTLNISDISALKVCFGISAVLVLFIMLEKFKALRPGFFARLIQ